MEQSNEEIDLVKEFETVNHPKHYTSHPSGVECIEIVRHMSFNVGNAIKYLWRAGLKTPEHPAFYMGTPSGVKRMPIDPKHIEDLKKAAWYINDEITRLEKYNG